ncbi:hypothetical protein GUITHDRAFT_139050 [Guillardia theta CCMP2712]|uniref:NAD(P)(+)--arginine ADP-ribosyltransferase n=1 Tax=Guillardia theta (strain CCMP2712) TaxID=905079 RepID=L1JBM9_GUITC|nr:hypothetical protein GUITHDRAFT_139050 [Guillardia theta CCMP2712]EKX45495.1 hypothetical protein GUITHDRAFT_139050 [Guillardia theta CCMP2712]|eukprot:XP_005832475.1 hypothetical protein GUITHDRAFT_139050 [Guillardia theta CCMP2712]
MVRDHAGLTVLHWAVKRESEEIVKRLLKVGGKELIEVRSSDGLTAKDIVIRRQNKTIMAAIEAAERAAEADNQMPYKRAQELIERYSTTDQTEGTKLLSLEEYKTLINLMLKAHEGSLAESRSEDRFKSDPRTLVCGQFKHAAQGLEPLLQVKLKDAVYDKMRDAINSMREEVERLGAEDLREDLEYVLSEAAREEEKDKGIMDKGHAGMRLRDFKNHTMAQQANLSEEEVAALRLYTLPSFTHINNPLRDQNRVKTKQPHPLPLITFLIVEGLKKMRAIEGINGTGMESTVLWRGMKNLILSDQFVAEGGTELAPMSTSRDLHVAAGYSMSGQALVFRIKTRNSLQRGVDVSWLSAFPAEEEVLFPPLTYLQPTGLTQEVELGKYKYKIVEVEPTLA